MKTIHKYPLAVAETQTLELPVGAQIIHLGVQGGRITLPELMLWVLVDTEAVGYDLHTFRIVGTGREVGADCGPANHIGTVQMGEFVWHVFRPSIRLGEMGAEVRLPSTIAEARREMDEANALLMQRKLLSPEEMCRHHADTLQRIGTLLGLPAGSDLHMKCEERIRELIAGWNAEMRASRAGGPPPAPPRPPRN